MVIVWLISTFRDEEEHEKSFAQVFMKLTVSCALCKWRYVEAMEFWEKMKKRYTSALGHGTLLRTFLRETRSWTYTSQEYGCLCVRATTNVWEDRSLHDLKLTTAVVTPKSGKRSLHDRSVGEQRTKSSQDGGPGADEDMQSHFPIHLGCTKMNWEWKQTGWWRDSRSCQKFTSLYHIPRRTAEGLTNQTQTYEFVHPQVDVQMKVDKPDLKRLRSYLWMKRTSMLNKLILWRKKQWMRFHFSWPLKFRYMIISFKDLISLETSLFCTHSAISE